jgi:hypothetical protein
MKGSEFEVIHHVLLDGTIWRDFVESELGGARLRTLAEHCWDHSHCLAGYLSAKYISVAEWLRIASGLIRIEFDIARFDTSLFMCGFHIRKIARPRVIKSVSRSPNSCASNFGSCASSWLSVTLDTAYSFFLAEKF